MAQQVQFFSGKIGNNVGNGEKAGNQDFPLFSKNLFQSSAKLRTEWLRVEFFTSCRAPFEQELFNLKVALQILGRKFYKKSSLYSQRILIFIHKTPVVKNHLTTGEITELLRPRLTPTGILVYFYMSSLLIYILEIHRRKFQTSDEDIMEKKMFVILWNLSVISLLIFPQCFFFFFYFFISGAKSKKSLRGYVAF